MQRLRKRKASSEFASLCIFVEISISHVAQASLLVSPKVILGHQIMPGDIRSFTGTAIGIHIIDVDNIPISDRLSAHHTISRAVVTFISRFALHEGPGGKSYASTKY